MGKLDGKVALVTGGGSGIGRGIAQLYAKEGAKVLVVGRRLNALEETADGYDGICCVAADLTKTEDVTKVVDYIKENLGGQLDILVNNAGWCPIQPLKEMTIDDYDNAFDLDVRALVDMTIQTLPMIIAAKGNIINMSSVGTTHRSKNLSMYQGAKAAVENFTRVWALELAGDGVRVNAIAPGAIETPIWNVPGVSEEEAKAHQQHIASGIPMGYVGEPADIAAMALYLVLPEARYIDGAIMAVDGAMGAI